MDEIGKIFFTLNLVKITLVYFGKKQNMLFSNAISTTTTQDFFSTEMSSPNQISTDTCRSVQVFAAFLCVKFLKVFALKKSAVTF